MTEGQKSSKKPASNAAFRVSHYLDTASPYQATDMAFRNIPDVPPQALRAMAHFYASEARRLIAAAGEIERRQSRRAAAKRHIEKLVIAGQAAQDSDLPIEEAARVIAAAHDVPEATIRAHAKKAERAKRNADRARRDREIMRLAALGWINRDIGQHIGLSERQVQRIISTILKRQRRPG